MQYSGFLYGSAAAAQVRELNSLRGFWAFPESSSDPFLWSADGLTWITRKLNCPYRPTSQPIFPKPGTIVFPMGGFVYSTTDYGRTWRSGTVVAPDNPRAARVVYNEATGQYFYTKGAETSANVANGLQYSNDLISWSNCGNVNYGRIAVGGGYTIRYNSNQNSSASQSIQRGGVISGTSSFTSISNQPFGTSSSNNRTNEVVYSPLRNRWMAIRYDSTLPNIAWCDGEAIGNSAWSTRNQSNISSGSKCFLDWVGGAVRFMYKPRVGSTAYFSQNADLYFELPLGKSVTTYWLADGFPDMNWVHIISGNAGLSGPDIINLNGTSIRREITLPHSINSVAYCAFD